MALRTKKSSKAGQTVREKTQTRPKTRSKSRRLKQTAGSIKQPFLFATKQIRKVTAPLQFVLRPFKTRPARFLGRLISSILLLRYFRNSWKELKQVTWPDRKETRQLTIAVFIFAIVFGVIVTITDYGLDKVFKKVLLQK